MIGTEDRWHSLIKCLSKIWVSGFTSIKSCIFPGSNYLEGFIFQKCTISIFVCSKQIRGLFSWHDVCRSTRHTTLSCGRYGLRFEVSIWCLDCCAVLLKLEWIFMLISTGVELDTNWLNYQTKRSFVPLSSGFSFMNHFWHFPLLRAMWKMDMRILIFHFLLLQKLKPS